MRVNLMTGKKDQRTRSMNYSADSYVRFVSAPAMVPELLRFNILASVFYNTKLLQEFDKSRKFPNFSYTLRYLP